MIHNPTKKTINILVIMLPDFSFVYVCAQKNGNRNCEYTVCLQQPHEVGSFAFISCFVRKKLWPRENK